MYAYCARQGQLQSGVRLQYQHQRGQWFYAARHVTLGCIQRRHHCEKFKEVYGRYPKYFLADQIYLNRENRKYLKEKNILIMGQPQGRPKKNDPQTAAQKYRKKKIAAKRNHVEGKFGQAKRGYHLNNIMARLPETSESWVSGILMVMNLNKLMEVAEKTGAFLCALKIRHEIHRFFFFSLVCSQYTPSGK